MEFSLRERLERVRQIVNESNTSLSKDNAADGTGFLSLKSAAMMKAVMLLVSVVSPPRKLLDMGCGNGGFALLAAAAGYDSYGIDINNYLISRANELREKCERERLLLGRCCFVAGDMILPDFRAEYRIFKNAHNENETSMPVSDDDGSCYTRVGLSLEDAEIIYCWSWPTQSRFLYNYLERTAKENCVFVLPGYIRYTQGEHMNEYLHEPNKLILYPLTQSEDIFIGRRAT